MKGSVNDVEYMDEVVSGGADVDAPRTSLSWRTQHLGQTREICLLD